MTLGSIFGVNADLAALLLRLTLGSLFIVHGYSKLRAEQRKQGAEWMKSMGLPGSFVLLGGVVEFFGGIALILGLFTSIVAVLFALWMVSTSWLQIAKMKTKYTGGWELDVILLLTSLALAVVGGGAFSLDTLLGFGSIFTGDAWNLTSLVLRLAIGGSFIIHGYPKLGPQRKRTADWLKSMGYPAALGPIAGIAEFFGGIALVLGIVTSIVPWLFVAWTLGLTWFSIAKIKKKYMGGYELDLTLLLASCALAVLGGGTFSLDRILGI